MAVRAHPARGERSGAGRARSPSRCRPGSCSATSAGGSSSPSALGTRGARCQRSRWCFLLAAIIGIGLRNVAIALAILGLPPILTNTFVAVRQVDRTAVEAAEGMGMRGAGVIARIELPLAAPTIMSGIRTAAINIFATATIASFVGLSTLGDLVTGRNVYGDDGVVAGAIVIALLAMVIELVLAGVQRLVTPRGLNCSAAAKPHRIRAPRRGGDGVPEAEEALDEHQDPVASALRVARRGRTGCRRGGLRRRQRRVIDGRHGGRADPVEPRQLGGHGHRRVQELHRAVHPRPDLRPGSRGRRLQREDQAQPGLGDHRAEGDQGRPDQRLSGVHLHRARLVLPC